MIQQHAAGTRCKGPAAPRAPGDAAPGPTPALADTSRGAGAIRCAACGGVITSHSARSELGGAHEHTFMNPAGIAFRIGCFSAAPGCVGIGEESTHWTWFPGHAWRVAVCRSCHAHVGWSFRSTDGVFHGLILDRLAADADTG